LVLRASAEVAAKSKCLRRPAALAVLVSTAAAQFSGSFLLLFFKKEALAFC
jgi:hypothetical protein